MIMPNGDSELARLSSRREGGAALRSPVTDGVVIGRAVSVHPQYMDQPRRFSSSGMTWNRSPTRPMSAIWNIGASPSLLRDDQAGVLDPGQVLDCTGYAEGHVELGRNDLPGLAHLHVIRHETGVDGSAGCADRGADLCGKCREEQS